ncbi:MAG TPA: PKD domain-containing protein, partial [Candidatus Thermoplasmatota archaeon]|nr:PKD domain-containing protein [Candidatus Thermoplasmatota archaeon]
EVGRSAPQMPVATGGFGALGYTSYPVDFVTTAPIATGATLTLDLFVQGATSYFVGYEGAHASSFTLTGVGGPPVPVASIASPGQGAGFDKNQVSSVPVSGTATFPGGAVQSVDVSVDDASFATGALAVSGAASWSATWDLSGVALGTHTIYARAVQDGTPGPVDSVGVVVTQQANGRPGSVEVQVVPAGTLPAPGGWSAASSYDDVSGAWSDAWDTDGMANGDYDFHARLVADGTEVGHDAFRAFLRNSRAPVLDAVGDQSVVEGNALLFGLSASDLDDDALSFSASGMPDGMALTDHGDGTASVAWAPRFDQAGTYDVTFTVSDGGATDSAHVQVVAINAAAALRGDGRGFATIQGALDDALAGDRVVVFPGTHAEAVTMRTAGVTLCSTSSGVLTPSQVACLANAAATILAPAGGAAVTVLADDATVRDLTLQAGIGASAAGARRFTMVSNILKSTGMGVLAADGGDHVLQDNLYQGVGTAIRLEGATGVRAERERVEGAGTVLSLGSGSQPTGNVLTLSCIRDAASFVRLDGDVSGVTVDARGNDWGVYTVSEVDAGVHDAGTGNTVLTYPFLAEDCATPLLRPTADFVAGPDPVYAVVDTVEFTDTSVSGGRPLVAWAWAFGDGATSTEQNPTHIYADAGTYTVSLTVTDSAELSHTTSHAVTLLPWFAPIADLAAAPNPTDRLTAVEFTDQSTPGTGTIVDRLLEFGDGASSGETTTAHTYATLGTFDARLTLTDNKGQHGVAVVSIAVLNIAPVADGDADRLETDRLTPVHFTDASTDADGTVTGWLWAFGDGATSTERNPTHTYSRLGTFQVDLTASDNDGGTHTAEIAKVKVKNLHPRSGAASSTTEANRVDPVQFTDQSSDPDGSVAAWLWNFGDGTTSAEQNPAHTFGSLGTFTVGLHVTDDDGDTSDVASVQIVVVNLPPTAGMGWSPDDPLVFQPVLFEDESVDRDGDIVSWSWAFGDGATSRMSDPAHAYTDGGLYTVTLSVEDDDGAAATFSTSIAICEPGADVSSLIEVDQLHIDLDGCIKLNGGDLVPLVEDTIAQATGDLPPPPVEAPGAFDVLELIFAAVHQLNEDTIGLPGL